MRSAFPLIFTRISLSYILFALSVDSQPLNCTDNDEWRIVMDDGSVRDCNSYARDFKDDCRNDADDEGQLAAVACLDSCDTCEFFRSSGFEVVKGTYGWMGWITQRGESYKTTVCGGTLIATNLLLTAKHCANKGLLNPEDYYQVEFNRHNVSKSSEEEEAIIVNVVEIVDHPDNNIDISIWRLDRVLTDIVPAQLDFDGVAEKSKLVAFLGWGLAETDDLDNILKKRNSPVANCESHVSNDTSICAGGPDAGRWHVACPGDSGGPLLDVHHDVDMQIGVISYGDPDCGDPLLTTVNVKISHPDVSSFIKNVSGEVCQNTPMDWTDMRGDSCEAYQINTNWCNHQATHYLADEYGTDASRACCACGGGSLKLNVCENYYNFPTCSIFETQPELCSKSSLHREPNGDEPKHACCVCGGGLQRRTPDICEDDQEWESLYGMCDTYSDTDRSGNHAFCDTDTGASAGRVDGILGKDACPVSCNNCPGECFDNEWRCDDGECILRDNTCDGIEDCDDGSDEAGKRCVETPSADALPNCNPDLPCNEPTPTNPPSAVPTVSPTPFPTNDPTVMPSQVPSAIPSPIPSFSPTYVTTRALHNTYCDLLVFGDLLYRFIEGRYEYLEGQIFNDRPYYVGGSGYRFFLFYAELNGQGYWLIGDELHASTSNLYAYTNDPRAESADLIGTSWDVWNIDWINDRARSTQVQCLSQNERTCGEYLWQCISSEQCITINWLCDDIVDCEDRSDEWDQTCNPSTRPPPSYPTSNPTSLPTGEPTNQPTEIPTNQPPTQSPTDPPTQLPTQLPTRNPTETLQPTQSRTPLPSEVPIIESSESPSSPPPQSPDFSPPQIPPQQPTQLPIELPIELPTATPTDLLTSSPTSPSQQPIFDCSTLSICNCLGEICPGWGWSGRTNSCAEGSNTSTAELEEGECIPPSPPPPPPSPETHEEEEFEQDLPFKEEEFTDLETTESSPPTSPSVSNEFCASLDVCDCIEENCPNWGWSTDDSQCMENERTSTRELREWNCEISESDSTPPPSPPSPPPPPPPPSSLLDPLTQPPDQAEATESPPPQEGALPRPPTESPQPTTTPTILTLRPTLGLTSAPTIDPTGGPTSLPTSATTLPTSLPTILPSSYPSTTPTVPPSPLPSSNPSPLSTFQPSQLPPTQIPDVCIDDINWQSIYGFCESYGAGQSNNQFCGQDRGTSDVLAQDACKLACGNC